MVRVLVGSQNPVKVDAVRETFSKFFEDLEVTAIWVDSKISNQPLNEKIFEGAKNRAYELKRINEKKKLDANYFVGIEGGATNFYSKWFAVNWSYIIDEKGRSGYGASPFYELPEKVTKQLLNGIELGDVMDEIVGEHNTKHKGGAIHYFTKGIMDRKSLTMYSLVTALVPFLNKELFFKE